MCHLKGRIPSLLKYLSYFADHANTSNGQDSAFSEQFVDLQSGKKEDSVCVQKLSHICMLNRSVLSDYCDPKKCSPPGSSLHGTLWARIYRHFPTSSNNCFLQSTLDSRQCFPIEFLVMMGMFYICSYDMVVTRHVSQWR